MRRLWETLIRMAKNDRTWLGYLDKLSRKDFDPQQLNIEGAEKILAMNSSFHSFFFHSVPMLYLLDYTTGSYMTMSKSSKVMLGYDPSEWMDNGIGFTIDVFHKDDLRLFDEKIFPDRLQILKNIPYDQHKNYIFSHNFRMRNHEGDFTNLLQRSCFVKSDVTGKPLVSMGMVLNVNHFKKENPIIQLVDKINPADDSCETISKKVFFLHEEDQLFTKREKEILGWLADGLTSKEIADKLFICNGTVIIHRKNMLLKSGTKNVAELVSFSLRKHII